MAAGIRPSAEVRLGDLPITMAYKGPPGWARVNLAGPLSNPATAPV